ncbi:MAG: hypothetical protein WAL38_38185, partial [Solirubrobacteraceae bacterium]
MKPGPLLVAALLVAALGVRWRRWPARPRALAVAATDRLAQVETFLGRHGGKTIIVGRFIGV